MWEVSSMEQEEFEDAALGSSSRVSIAHVLHTGKTVSDDVDSAQSGLRKGWLR